MKEIKQKELSSLTPQKRNYSTIIIFVVTILLFSGLGVYLQFGEKPVAESEFFENYKYTYNIKAVENNWIALEAIKRIPLQKSITKDLSIIMESSSHRLGASYYHFWRSGYIDVTKDPNYTMKGGAFETIVTRPYEIYQAFKPLKFVIEGKPEKMHYSTELVSFLVSNIEPAPMSLKRKLYNSEVKKELCNLIPLFNSYSEGGESEYKLKISVNKKGDVTHIAQQNLIYPHIFNSLIVNMIYSWKFPEQKMNSVFYLYALFNPKRVVR